MEVMEVMEVMEIIEREQTFSLFLNGRKSRKGGS
jgi:hypothetical protein